MKNEKNKNTHKNLTCYVSGMHCASCEILVAKELNNIPGVSCSSVNLKDCTAEVSTEKGKLNLQKINSKLSDFGYKIHLSKSAAAVHDKKPLQKSDILKIVIVLFAFLSIFYMFETSGILSLVTLNPQSPIITYFAFGLLAGLSSCAALVGGILLALSKNWSQQYATGKPIAPFVYFNVSRVLAFAVLGGILGIVGSSLQFSVASAALLTLFVAVIMLVIGLQMLGVSWFKGFKLFPTAFFSDKLNTTSFLNKKYTPALVGAATFFVPCGFTLVAQTNAFSSGSFYTASLSLLAFALGTLPILVIISFTSVKLYSNPSFSRKFSLFSGLLIVFFGLYTLNSQLNVLGLPSLSDLKNVAVKTNTVEGILLLDGSQLVQIEARGFEYFPRNVALKKGIKTRMEVLNSGVYGCAQALYAPGLYPEVVYLQQGINVMEFTPKVAGTYKISCSMGMVAPVTVNVY